MFLGSLCSPTIPQSHLLPNHSHSLPASPIFPQFSASPPPTIALIGPFPTHVWTKPLANLELYSPRPGHHFEPWVISFGAVVVEISSFSHFEKLRRDKDFLGVPRPVSSSSPGHPPSLSGSVHHPNQLFDRPSPCCPAPYPLLLLPLCTPPIIPLSPAHFSLCTPQPYTHSDRVDRLFPSRLSTPRYVHALARYPHFSHFPPFPTISLISRPFLHQTQSTLYSFRSSHSPLSIQLLPIIILATNLAFLSFFIIIICPPSA